jgi:sterol desaturase/sphingolipid hydroxylase (fatty acid hydroxylase superfamily)
MPPYLSGVFVMLAGIGMLVGREPLSLMQYAALEQARIAGKNRDQTLSRLRRVIVIGSIAFVLLGLYWVFNPLSG